MGRAIKIKIAKLLFWPLNWVYYMYREHHRNRQKLLIFSFKSNIFNTFCPPVRGDNPRILASGLSPVQADNLWYSEPSL